jgi:hypothetical protein
MDSLDAIGQEGLRPLIERVGASRYAAARERAWRTAAGTGRGTAAPTAARDADDDLLASVASDLADWTWYASARPEAERLALGLALYRDLPSYAVLLYSTGAYRGFAGEIRARFWSAFRALLADADDRLAAPVAYALWCDYFEDAATVQDAWRGIDPATLAGRALERLLDVAGPVPWALKAPLYERLLPDAAWHRAIFRSLLFSRFDAYGQIDAPEALALLNRLRLPGATPGLGELRVGLAVTRDRAAGPREQRRRRRRSG